MKLFTAGQEVWYDGKLWYITGFKERDGKTIYCLKRGCYHKEVDETEVETK